MNSDSEFAVLSRTFSSELYSFMSFIYLLPAVISHGFVTDMRIKSKSSEQLQLLHWQSWMSEHSFSLSSFIYFILSSLISLHHADHYRESNNSNDYTAAACPIVTLNSCMASNNEHHTQTRLLYFTSSSFYPSPRLIYYHNSPANPEYYTQKVNSRLFDCPHKSSMTFHALICYNGLMLLYVSINAYMRFNDYLKLELLTIDKVLSHWYLFIFFFCNIFRIIMLEQIYIFFILYSTEYK